MKTKPNPSDLNHIPTIDLIRKLKASRRDTAVTTFIAYVIRARAVARCVEFSLPLPPQLSSL